MKVYFTGQLLRKSDYIKEYNQIIKHLKFRKYTVLQDTLDYDASEVLNQDEDTLKKYYKKYFEFLDQMDFCVAEISFPSTINIGFDVSNVINTGKPVIAMYRKGEDPKFISNLYSNKMIKVEYTLENVEEVLDWALAEVKLLLSRRFTFFIDSKIDRYLEKVSKDKSTNKSDYLRNLVYKDMKK